MSNYNEEVLTEQLYILRDFLYNYSSFRILSENFENLIKFGSQEYWVLTINAHYFQAINLWCMVFGTTSNETHWRKLGLNKEFKPEILTSLDLNAKDYDLYWEAVIDWRNMYSAHRVPDFREPTPDLKLARNVVFVYEEWVSKNIDDVISFSLELYEENFLNELRDTFKHILFPLTHK